MRLAYHDDRTGWGRTVAAAAVSRGHTIDQKNPDVAFTRLLTIEPDRTFGFNAWHRFRALNIPTLPGLDAEWYDNKLKQYDILKRWLPPTEIFWCRPSDETIETMKFPLISKAHTGAQSRNVRLLDNAAQAKAEAAEAFSVGIPLKPSGWQRNYLYWQRFIPGNAGDIRVCITGDYAFGLLRENRKDLPFASGSGRFVPIQDLDDYRVRQALILADSISTILHTRWQAYDFVFEGSTAYCLEASSAWNEKAYAECPLFRRSSLERTYLTASSWAHVAVDELEKMTLCLPS